MKSLAVLFMSSVFWMGSVSAQALNVPEGVLTACKAKYPLVKSFSWYKDKDVYAARFYEKGEPRTARFNGKGEWLDETKKLSFGELRNNVRNAFSQSKFSTWQAQEVNEILEKNKEVQYRIRVKNGEDQSLRYIYFDAKGQMKKEVLTM